MYSRIITANLKFGITYRVIFLLILSLAMTASGSGSRFSSSYSCSDGGKSCQSSGVRTVEGFQVHRDCWEYSYPKTCNYPSKNNCGQYAHCYLVAFRECLLTDSIGNCVNQVKEYSCKRWEPNYLNKEKVRYGSEDKEGVEKLICKGLPCIDGNCIDKSYDSNNEMMDSVARLYAISQMKGVTDMNFKLFAGYPAHCTKKPTDYSNCCKLNGGSNNWGHNLGAKCTKDEQTLIEQRKNNLCVYVGKSSSARVLSVTKHHWCCFGNILNKVLQVQGRKQLGMTLGNGGNPDCRGLTLTEILRLDFDKMDFSEFEAEIMKKMKIPGGDDLQARVKGSLPNMQKPKDERTISANGRDGINNNIVDDSWEAEEERMLERERLERERQAELERQVEERKKEIVRVEEERKKQLRRKAKENELLEAQKQEAMVNNQYWSIAAKAKEVYGRELDYHWYTNVDTPLAKEFRRLNSLSSEKASIRLKIEKDLKDGNY